MKNRFFTLLIIPEKSSQVKRIVIPAWLARMGVVALSFLGALAVIMLFNYSYVMGQLSEYKQLKSENRKLQQQVQVFKNRIDSIESTLERVKTFSTRLRVITNIGDRTKLLESLNQKLPEASKNIGIAETDVETEGLGNLVKPQDKLAASLVAPPDPIETEELQEISAQLDQKMNDLHRGTLTLEATLQDQYEQLANKRAFLAALPSRKPAEGYYTSGFGVRPSPYGGKIKMHEGLDIANRPGTPIFAPADGVVTYAESKAGYGQIVILDHGYGLETWYGHIKKATVRRGQHVRRGEQIAQLGNTGRSTGPHVHYEVRIHGIAVDPLPYILEN